MNLLLTSLVVFIGTFMNDPGAGIYSCLYDPATGELSDPRLEVEAIQSSYLTLSQDERFLYTFQTGENGLASLFSYRVGEDGRSLTLVDSVATGCKDPCHIRLLDGGGIVAAACYGDGKTIWCRVDDTGRFVGDVGTQDHNAIFGSEGLSRAHQVNSDGRLVYVADLGLDRMVVYRIVDSELIYHTFVELPAGSGPRHCAFSPSGDRMAVVCELNSTVVVLAPDEQGVFSLPLQSDSTLPADGGYRCAAADIHYSPDGSRLYASERGFGSVVCWDVDPVTGSISDVGTISEGVNWPRGFAVSPDGEWLLVANQEGNNVSSYRPFAGASPASSVLTLKPSCVVVRH